MKKSKLSLGTILGLFSVIAMSSCTNISADPSNIVSFTGVNGETVNISTDDIYANYKTDVDGVKKFYDALVEVVIRNEMDKPENAEKLKTINSSAKNRVEGVKEKATSNASTNGTSYEVEFEALLDSYGCEDETELFNYFAYTLMKEKLSEEYFSDAQLAELLTEPDTGYLDEKVPYHVKHILVNVSATSSNLYNGEISSSEAIKLSSVVQELAQGKSTFGYVAYTKSDDSNGSDSSKANYGDLGIMDKDTNYVNEFRLGLYTYDYIYNHDASRDNAGTVLGIDDSVETSMNAIGLGSIGTIPYGSILSLNQVALYEKTINGASVNKGLAYYYPRNVLFNKYFNKHNVSIITPNDVTTSGIGVDGKLTSAEDYSGTINMNYVNNSNGRFVQLPELGGQYALCDEKGNVILVVRAGGGSYEGVHLMVVERDFFDSTKNGTTLGEYYTTYIPGDDGYPVDPAGNPKNTFVNYLSGEASSYTARATKVKDAIKGYDPMINDRMYKELFDSQSVTVHDSVLKASIDEYLESQRLNNEYKSQETFNDSWTSYLRLLTRQEYLRNIKDGYTPKRLLSETCALKFYTDSNSEAYTVEGGACYYVE